MKFYLGVSEPSWLPKLEIPTFINRTRLDKRKSLPIPAGSWALDSGAFSEISKHGEWTICARRYARLCSLLRDAIPRMEFAVQQDWMCEPHILRKTGKTVLEHQELTVRNYLDLCHIDPSIKWAPVIQGWTPDDYLRCVDLFETNGVNLSLEPIVGVGSICRRQGTDEAVFILRKLAKLSLRLHAFGLKKKGIGRSARDIVSADSMAWSLNGRRTEVPCQDGKRNCANCLHFALSWRDDLLREIEKVNDERSSSRWLQLELFA